VNNNRQHLTDFNFLGDQPSCPENFPWAYNNGKHCCATNREKDAGSEKCNGSLIGLDSECCENDAHSQCPTSNCMNHAKGELFILLYTFIMPQPLKVLITRYY